MEMMSEKQFSPVSKSLSAKTAQGKNLVGSARHVRDLAADIHANIQQWNETHLQGDHCGKSCQDRTSHENNNIFREKYGQIIYNMASSNIWRSSRTNIQCIFSGD
ncbi:uncharacterized protein LOC122400773 [Colletes gigas]|uniref:uncharacterized protein LOC122400773 n=1 Tax=Colletes gigas TaxID=935657 RepID=UPI001C9A842B|nr:uncharacterized protein LOC122400773 [Colletes gigas]